MKTLHLSIIMGIGLFLLFLMPPPSAQAAPYTFSSSIGGPATGQFNIPTGIAVNSTGFVFVIDSGNNRIQIFDSSGNWKKTIGGNSGLRGSGAGWENGQFENPEGIAVNDTGFIFVADSENHRLQIFDPSGNWKQSLGNNGIAKPTCFMEGGCIPGGIGSGNDSLYHPNGVAVNSAGTIFVADGGNYRLQIFDPSGNWKQTIGGNEFGLNAYQFRYPSGIALNSAGFIFVSDGQNNRTLIFDSSGHWKKTIDKSGSGPGIAVNSTGFIFVTDSGSNCIRVFDPSGNWKKTINTFGSANGQLGSPVGIAINSTGFIFVADSGNNRVQIFDPSGNWKKTFGGNDPAIYRTGIGSGSGNGQFNFPAGIAVNSTGFIFVADSGNNRIQIFDSSGHWKQSIHNFGSTNDHYLNNPWSITINRTGSIFVSDSGNHRIQIFDPSGNWKKTIGSKGTGPFGSGNSNGQFFNPYGIALNNTGFIFIADGGNNRIQIFDPSGKWVQTIGGNGPGIGGLGSANGQFHYPVGIAVNSTGFIFVSDSGNQRIQIFNSSGIWKKTIGGNGPLPDGRSYANDGFNNLAGIAVNNTGFIFVADEFNHRIQIFDPSGNWLQTLGGNGFGSGVEQLRFPSGVALNSTGFIFVADSGNDRIQIFSDVISSVPEFPFASIILLVSIASLIVSFRIKFRK